MAKHPTDFIQQNNERTMQAADVGLNWFRDTARQNFKHNKVALDGLLELTRRMVGEFSNQSSAFCEHSMSFAEETLSNAFDCGSKMLRLREPQELAQVQIDFVSQQAQAIATEAKELNERLAKGAEGLANTINESTRKQSRAA
jgi:hypothetical protein